MPLFTFVDQCAGGFKVSQYESINLHGAYLQWCEAESIVLLEDNTPEPFENWQLRGAYCVTDLDKEDRFHLVTVVETA